VKTIKKWIIAFAVLGLAVVLLGVKSKEIKNFFSKESLAETNLKVGIRYLQEKRVEEAGRALKAALRLKPDYAIAHYYLGKAYLINGGPIEQEMIEYKRAIELDPNFIEARIDLGAAYYAQKDFDSAIKGFEGVLEIDPKNPVAYGNLGRVAMAQGERAKAEDFLKRAISLDPSYSLALNNLGNLYFLEGKMGAAKEIFEKSLTMTPNNPGIHYFLAKIADKEKSKELAVSHWNTAVDLGLSGNMLKEAQVRLAELNK
jgi:Tfp pilus assembly protein PilF